MSASFVTFADLGKKKNLKTIEISPAIEVFAAKGEVDQVLCRMENAAPSYVRSLIPKWLHYSLKILERIIPSFPARNIEENLLDLHASRRLKKSDVTFLHPSFFPKALHAAKEKGSVAVGVAVLAHPDFSMRIMEDEYRLLSLDDSHIHDKGFYGIHNTATVANAFDYIVAISDLVKKSYIAHGFQADKIFVAPIDYDTELFKTFPGVDDGVFRVVYIAQTTPIKGLHYLLDAWQSLKLANAELVLVGGYAALTPDALKKRYDDAIAADPSIRWVGFTSDPSKYYQDATVFVFPSLVEGFGKVILEAMSACLPVITTEHAAGIVEDGVSGYIVPIRDESAIAEKIKFLYDHRDTARSMGQMGKKALENKAPYGEIVFEIYQEILKKEHNKEHNNV